MLGGQIDVYVKLCYILAVFSFSACRDLSAGQLLLNTHLADKLQLFVQSIATVDLRLLHHFGGD